MKAFIYTQNDVLDATVHMDGGCEGMVEECTSHEDQGMTLESDDPDAANIRYCVPCLLSDYTDVHRVTFEREE